MEAQGTRLEAQTAALRKDMEAQGAHLEAQIVANKTELEAQIAELRSDIEGLKQSLPDKIIVRLGALMVTMTVVLLGVGPFYVRWVLSLMGS